MKYMKNKLCVGTYVDSRVSLFWNDEKVSRPLVEIVPAKNVVIQSTVSAQTKMTSGKGTIASHCLFLAEELHAVSLSLIYSNNCWMKVYL